MGKERYGALHLPATGGRERPHAMIAMAFAVSSSTIETKRAPFSHLLRPAAHFVHVKRPSGQ